MGREDKGGVGPWGVCQEMFRASPELRRLLAWQTILLLLGRGCVAWGAVIIASAVDAGRLGPGPQGWAMGAAGVFAIAKLCEWALSSLHSGIHARRALPACFDFCDQAMSAALRSPRLAGRDPVEAARRLDKKTEARHFIGSIFHHIAPPVIEIILCSAALAWMGFGALALAMAPAAAAHVWVAVALAPKARARVARALSAADSAQSTATQALEKAGLARAYGSQETLDRLLSEKSAQEREAFKRQALAADAALAMQNGLLALFAIAVFGGGYWMMGQGLASPGAFAALIGVCGSALGQLKNLAFAFDGMISCSEALSEHTRFLREAREAPAGLGAPRPRAPASLRLLDWRVSVEGQVVCRVDALSLAPGEKLYLAGASGAGKSSLLLSLLGAREASGRLLWGEDEVGAGAAGLCAHMPQESASMGGSLRDNLLLGKPSASEEEMWGALRLAGLGEKAEQLGGLGARLEWRGSNLSGGEAQRLSLARAILSGFPLLLLDEPTSGLDAIAEARAIAAIGGLRDRSAIICAHRLRAIPKGSRVAVMSEGAILEDGSLEELLAQGGLFSAMWEASEAGV